MPSGLKVYHKIHPKVHRIKMMGSEIFKLLINLQRGKITGSRRINLQIITHSGLPECVIIAKQINLKNIIHPIYYSYCNTEMIFKGSNLERSELEQTKVLFFLNS